MRPTLDCSAAMPTPESVGKAQRYENNCDFHCSCFPMIDESEKFRVHFHTELIEQTSSAIITIL